MITLSFFSCVKDEVENPVIDDTREYFPLIPGKFITYEVDSIVFDDVAGGNKKDTVHFELREEVSDYQLINNDTVHYIYRSRRNTPESNWQLMDVWTAKISNNEALRTEENLTFRKMLFPLEAGKKWIGTAYIYPQTEILVGTEHVQAYQYWEAIVSEFDIADQVGTFSFSDGEVMHIIQTEADDGYTLRYVMEKYARGIGLIHRIDTILDSKCLEPPGDLTPCLNLPWTEHASKGYILSQVMTSHN